MRVDLTIRLATLLLVVAFSFVMITVGCTPAPFAPPAPVPVPAAKPPVGAVPKIEQGKLSAEQLANILQINAWTFPYSGRELQCWLELEETGPKPVNMRYPEKGFLGMDNATHPQEGTVFIWWRKNEKLGGGMIRFQTGNGGYGIGLGPESFTFGWDNFSSETRLVDKDKLITGENGDAFAILDYVATETVKTGEPRKVHLKLMGRFSSN